MNITDWNYSIKRNIQKIDDYYFNYYSFIPIRSLSPSLHLFNKLLFPLQKQEAAKTLCTAEVLSEDWDQLAHCMNSYFKAVQVKQILLDLLLFGSYVICEINIVILEIFSKIGRSKIKEWALFVHTINQKHCSQELLRPQEQNWDPFPFRLHGSAFHRFLWLAFQLESNLFLALYIYYTIFTNLFIMLINVCLVLIFFKKLNLSLCVYMCIWETQRHTQRNRDR